MINFDRMQRQFEESKHYSCGESQADRLANWNVWKDAWKAGLASQAQQPAKLVFDSESARQFLIESVLPKFSDRTFADYVRNELAGDFAYQLAVYLQSQAQQTESQAIKALSEMVELWFRTRESGCLPLEVAHAQFVLKTLLPPAPEYQDNTADLESRDFYEIMQAYRTTTIDAAGQFEAVKAWLRNPTYEYQEPIKDE